MQEQESIQFSDLRKVLNNAHLRRSADLAQWLKQYLRQHRETRAEKSRRTSHVAHGTVVTG